MWLGICLNHDFAIERKFGPAVKIVLKDESQGENDTGLE